MTHAAVSFPLILRAETPADVAQRERLLDAAFGPGRFAKTCQRIREGLEPAEGLSLVAMENRQLVGTLRLWPILAGDRPALLLGPLAVAETHRAHGVGGALMRQAIEGASHRGHGAVLLVGDHAYYERFGFQPNLTAGLAMPGPVDRARFLGLELHDGALHGAAGLVRALPTAAQLRRGLRDAA